MRAGLKTTRELAKAFGVTVRSARRWLAKGSPALPTTKKAVAAWRRSRSGRAGDIDSELASDGAAKREGGETEHWGAQYRRVKALSAELDYKRKTGELIERDEVATLFVTRVTEVRSGLLVLPQRVAGLFPPDIRERIRKVLEEEIQTLLERYSRPSPLLATNGQPKKRRRKR